MQFNFNLKGRNIYSYDAYHHLIETLLAQGKTTGQDHAAEMIAYTKMNLVRMNRWDRKTVLSPEIIALLQKSRTQKWLVLSEAWCGDAAQNLPIIHKMAAAAFSIELKIILRDENLDIMDTFLTNGSRAVPKLIAIAENNEVLFTWGPRPKEMQESVISLKKAGLDYAEVLHKMYAINKGENIQKEFSVLLNNILL